MRLGLFFAETRYTAALADAFKVRSATAMDAPGILDCLRTAFEPYRASYTAAGFADTVLSADTIPHRLASMSVYVAEGSDGKIIGTIACSTVHDREGHLRGMAVLPEWHGRGVAEGLLDAAEMELSQRACVRITLDTTAPLKRAARFYEKRGYRLTGKVGDFFGMPLYEYAKVCPSSSNSRHA